MIPCSNPKAQYLTHKAEIDRALIDVLDQGRYILGQNVRGFESEFAAALGSAHGIGVASGTDALHLALRACGIGPGDEVIAPSHTAVATIAAIEMAGAVPVFADIDPDYYTIAPAKVEAMLGPRTKAIVAVHLYGQAADLDALQAIAKSRGLRLIEDCAQSHGALHGGRRLGSIGDLGCFSFYPTKNLGALGDGGLIVTGDAALAERCRLLREYGWAERYVSHLAGVNSRLDELQAAVLRIKLRTLDADNGRRGAVAADYDAGLKGSPLTLPKRRASGTHVFHQYVARSTSRDALIAHLKANGVEALIHYPVPVHLQKAYKGRIRGGDALPESERAAREVLSLPMYPELPAADRAKVVDAVRSFGK
ncbi:MAG: DegT/DnrJ/EryC1/StrS family aminotransferase [Planctomycetaceae bacterium]|nr:DegT/DnrJ/EryC1/StrS family aminotransferase [Planctomycetaceae bacterium]